MSADKEILKMLDNLVWHINTNREVLGDSKVLDHIEMSLKLIVEGNKDIQRWGSIC